MKALYSEKSSWAKRVVSVVLRSVGCALLAFLLFFAGVLAYDKFIRKSPAPSFFGYSFLVIATGSMSGAIEAGDVVIVKDTGDYETGDIVTYLPPGENVTVTHRIIRTEGSRYYTKGDANLSEDPEPVYIRQIVGEVVLTIPKVGIFIEWLKTPGGIISAVAFVALVVIGIGLLKKN